MKRLLILGGTGDANKLAAMTNEMLDLATIYSLAGRTHNPNIPLCKIRTGGFGGVDGLVNYLRTAKINFVIDATHPFADKIAANALEACNRVNIPRIKFCRPPWEPNEITWFSALTYSETVRKISTMGERIFLSIGANNLEAFSILSNKWFLIRAIEKPIHPIPLKNHNIIFERGPFDEIQERTLLTNFRIDVLVSKNSGGPPAAKLNAAHKLGIPIVVIEKPIPPAGKLVYTIEKTLDWLSNQT